MATTESCELELRSEEVEAAIRQFVLAKGYASVESVQLVVDVRTGDGKFERPVFERAIVKANRLSETGIDGKACILNGVPLPSQLADMLRTSYKMLCEMISQPRNLRICIGLQEFHSLVLEGAEFTVEWSDGVHSITWEVYETPTTQAYIFDYTKQRKQLIGDVTLYHLCRALAARVSNV